MSPAAAKTTKLRVALRASGFLVTSLLMSANGNVLPQLFFQRFHAERKLLLLAACLFLGTSAGIVGVLASRRGELRRSNAVAVVILTIGAEATLFLLRDALAYVAVNALAQFGANYLTNQIDRAATSRGDSDRRLYDGVSNGARLLGILAAPAFFTRFVGQAAPTFVVLGLAATIALASALSLAAPEAGRAPTGGSSAAAALARSDRLLFGYAASVYVALYLFAANLIYLLRDVVRLQDAVRRGGTAIVVVFASALLANALYAAVRGTGRPRRSALAAPVPMLAVAAAILLCGVAVPPPAIFAACAIIGATYGVFLAEIRDHASRGARESGKTELISAFNNLSNVSSLVAFGVMALLATLLRHSPNGTHGWVLGIIGVLPLAAVPLLLSATERNEA